MEESTPTYREKGNRAIRNLHIHQIEHQLYHNYHVYTFKKINF